MIFYESDSYDPHFNLAMEEYFFEKMDRGQSYFLLWQNDNTVVVGKYQNTAEEVNQKYVEENGIRVARRLSGGGAVYHDLGNLNFTFITDQADIDAFNFSVFVVPVINVLKSVGVKAEFNGRNDITIEGCKFSGNSQYMKKSRIMHHGCIMLDTDLSVVTKALQVKEAKFTSKAAKSVRSRVTTINRHAPAPLGMEAFKRLLKEEVFRQGNVETAVLSPAQLAEIRARRDRFYATWDWNYGRSPEYNMRKETKFPTGLVTVLLQANEGRIDDIRFFGDFFGNGEIRELEEILRGARLSPQLLELLRKVDIDHYMKGITAEDIYGLLMH
ncbi:MAG: lipoate--protein ligase [Clostridia bacterium]|nr:lipoate--protein ligase [Clostridia bacterium]